MNEFDASKVELLQQFEGMTAKELAARSGISERLLGAIKNGSSEFHEEDVEAICCATGFPKTFFLIKETAIPATALTFRKPSRMRARDIKKVSVEFSMLESTATRLMDMCGISDRSNWIDAIAPYDTPDGDDIERIAVETRACLGIPDSGPVGNVMWAFEKGGFAIATLKASCEEMEDSVEGISYPSGTIRPVVAYTQKRRSGDGIRFTIAHEAGHLVLQRKRMPATKKMREEEAHRFAGAFLLPPKDAKVVLNPKMELRDFVEIKAGWGIAISALITRAARMGTIDRERQRSLMMQMSARHWRRHEPVEVPAEQPVLFRQMLGSNFGKVISPTEVSISPIAASEFLGRPFDLIDTWAGGLQAQEATDVLSL